MVHAHKRLIRPRLACAVVVAVAAAAMPSIGQASAAQAAGAPGSSKPFVSAADATSTAPGSGSARQRTGTVPGRVIVSLAANTSVTGAPVAGARDQARNALTSNAQLNTVLRAHGAVSLRPLVPGANPAAAGSAGSTYVLQTGDRDSASVATSLRNTPGVAYAEPDRYVSTMDTGVRPLPATALTAAAARAKQRSSTAGGSASQAPAALAGSYASSIPTNYALADSAQSLLNSGGVDATGAFALLGKDFGQLPGAGEIVTDVTVADLTDASMADAGDGYVQRNGPTSVLQNGQRYLDLPSMPLIPAYVADPDGSMSATESVEGQDDTDGEAMLDFSVMSPLPDGDQRAGMTGSGYSDLLGIAPGAAYRLVVPQQPTTDQIAQALLAAAHQSPRPDVITCTLGFGTDAQGLPGRYLEDDPLLLSVVTSIVHRDGIVVAISANDGTRLFTPASVGPDGGSTATDLSPDAASATDIADDAASTTPTEVPDSGAIDVGAATLDDTLADGTAGPATTAETRITGAADFSSGFGSRVNLSAPGDNIIAFSHTTGGKAQDVTLGFNGGTSASAPQVAAAAAIVLQASRLAGHRLDPLQVRALLERTAHAVPTPAQIDQPLNVGPQIDVTAATEAALGSRAPEASAGPALVHLSVAHQVAVGDLGGEFIETTDPSVLDLSGPAEGYEGAGVVGPVTFGGDIVGLPADAKAAYTLTVGHTTWRSNLPAIRVTPAQLLGAAGLPMIATADRTLQLTYSVLIDGHVRASVSRTLTVGPTDGAYKVTQAPKAPAVVQAGRPVSVSYDLTGAAQYTPEIAVSPVGRWSPTQSLVFNPVWTAPLTGTKGRITIPASAFDDGGGIYGIGVIETTEGGSLFLKYFNDGEFTPIRVQGGSPAQRPAAPTLGTGTAAADHGLSITRHAPDFTLHYSVAGVPGAVSTLAEFSAPAPTNYGSFNAFSNADGTQLDDDGVDTPSTTHLTLPGTSGSAHLNALKLGLATSLAYNVRVFALDRSGRVVGQASPLSTLEVDDGLVPGNDLLMTFAAAGADSLAALVTSPDNGSQVVHYDTATGQYGAVMAADPNSFSEYEVLGVDPAGHRALLAHQAGPGAPTAQLESWNTATNSKVGSWSFTQADWVFIGAQVDRVRDRAALLLQSVTNPKNSEVVSIDLATGAAGTPIPITSIRPYGLLAIDQSTGYVYATSASTILLCIGGSTVDQVDLDTGEVTTPGGLSSCGHALAAANGTVYDLVAFAGSTKIPANTTIQSLDAATGAEPDPIEVLDEAPVAMAVDTVHDLAVVSYPWPQGLPSSSGQKPGTVDDQNATGVMAVVDLKTGQLVKTIPGFQVVNAHGDPLANLGTAYSIQLDPATRTAYTYGPYSQQIQQFSY
ncbi:MAG TPA: S8 family serine peptidase [Actinocrinis sp.]|nr:S8 family serine peptidase [Actinocrinis sp.]